MELSWNSYRNLKVKMEQDTSRNFKFNNFGSNLEIEIDEENKAKCPKCEEKFKRLIKHISNSTVCKQDLDYEKFSKEYDAFNHRKRQKAYLKKRLELNPTETRNLEANKKRMQRERKLDVDAELTRKNEATKKKIAKGKKVIS